MKAIRESTNIECENIEKCGLRGDAIELKLCIHTVEVQEPSIKFPTTTGVATPLTEGKINRLY